VLWQAYPTVEQQKKRKDKETETDSKEEQTETWTDSKNRHSKKEKPSSGFTIHFSLKTFSKILWLTQFQAFELFRDLTFMRLVVFETHFVKFSYYIKDNGFKHKNRYKSIFFVLILIKISHFK
jgi:hypothetical protein